MSAKKPWEMDWPDEKEKKPWEMDWDDESSSTVDLVSSHETPPAQPRRNVVRERLEFERQRSGKPLAGTDPARLQEISASDPTVDPNLERLSKMGFRQDVDQFVPKTNAGPLGPVPSHGPAPPPEVSLGRKAADFVGIGGATTAQAALTGVGQMLGGAADTGRSLGDVGAMAFTDEAGGPRLTGDDFAGRKPGGAAPVTWGSGGPVGRGLGWARQTLRGAGDQVADSPKVLEAKRILSQVESGEIGDVVPTLLENPNAIAALGGSAAGSLIPQIAAATLTPGLAVAPMFFQELAGIEEQQRAHEQETGQNMDPLERFGRQAGSSAAIAALERIVPGEIAGALKGRAGGAARALMTPLKEGATEAAQRGIADYFATEEGQLNPAGMLMEGLAGGMGGAAVAPAHMGPAYEGPEVKGRDYGDEFLKHRKNMAAYKAAREKSAAQEKYTAGREELGKLEDQLQAVVNQAGETQDPKAAKAAAALKQKADSLRVELGQVQLAPLSQEDELWIARGAPKFGDALGGGATEAASVEGRAFRGTDENGRPLRLGYSIDEVEAKLSQWREVDPKLGTTNVVVHDSILSPDFFDGLTPEVQERVKRAVANGIDPAELSARSPIPGFYRNGETHVLAPALISLDHLNELVGGHELTHDVIDNLQPDEVVQLFGRGGKAKALGALARRAKKKDQLGYTVGKEYADETPEVRGEEVLAGATEYAGTRGPASRLDQARAAVKDRLRAALPDWAQGVLGAASDAEIRVLLDRTRQIAAKRAKSGSVTVAGRGSQKATAPAEGKAPSLTQLGQAINDAIPDAVALEAAMRQIQSDDPDTIMAGIDALLATDAPAVPPGMKAQPKARTDERPTRHRVFEGGSPIKASPGPGVLDARDNTLAYRITGQPQIDDISATGLVRAKVGRMRGGRQGEVQWSRGHESLGYYAATNDGRYVLVTDAAVHERQDGLPASELKRVYKAENGQWVDVTDSVLASPEPSVDVDEMLATQEANDRARLQAERDEAAARADAAEKALRVLEAQRKAEQDQKAKDAKAAKDAEAGRAVLEQLPDEEARRAEEARTQRLLDAARSGDVDPSGALTPAIHQFLGQDAMDRVLANPLGPETPRTKSLKKQPPGTAPTEAVPPTTVPPAAGELQPEAPTGKAPKKGGKARLSIRGGIYEGQERRQERDRRIADVLRKRPDQLTREDVLALHEHASENPKSGLPSEAVWNARDHAGKHISVIDVDGLGYLNDKHGFDAGDAMLQAVGHVSRVVKDRHPGVEHYHISGDEFRAEAGSREEADAYSDDLRETLKKTRFLITDGRGARHVVTGLSTSHGVDITPELADRQMKGDTDDATLQPNSKRARQLRGERAAKGERPPGVTVDPLEGRAGSAPGVLGLATRSDQDRRDRDAGAADEVGTKAKHSRRQESTPEFKEWFGDWEDPKAFSSKREPGKEPVSQAVDASGRPLVVYHGTRGDFGTFNTRTRGYNSNVFGSWETDRHAAFFAEKPTDAEAFTESGGDRTGGNIRPVYLNAKAPIDFTKDGSWFEDFLSEMEAEGVNPRWIRNSGKTWELFDGEDGKRFVEAAKKIGYDSVIFDDSNPDTGDSFRAWVVFDPEQIKSATGNDGTFSKTDPDIRRSRRNSAEAQLSWEAVPGMNTGRLTGIHDAPYEIRAAFTTDMGRHFKDAKGRDVIAPAFGLKETDRISVPGYYLNSEGKEERNPSRQLFLQLPDSPDAMDKLAGYAAARGYVLRQEAVGVHVARNLREGEAENGYFVEMGSVPTEAQYEAYVSAMTQAAGEDAFKFVAVPTHGGINLWTWDDSISPTEIARINDAASAAVDSDVTMQARPIKVDSRYIENDWSKEAPNGEGYVQQITAAGGPPDLQARLDKLRKAADGTAEEWAKRHGWGAHKPAPVTPVDARIPRDVEALVGRDVKSTGQTKRNLFQQIANVVNGKDLREMRLAAESGRAMKGWYRDSAAAVRKLFGEDTEAFVATLAALSPRQGVRENLKMAVAVWEEWDKRGRPTDPEKIREMFPRIGTVLDPETGKMREKHALVDMGGRIPNVVTALSTLGSQELSGAKVESFRRNLLGDFDAVANDTWMAQFADISQSVFGKPAGYLAGSYMVRRVAKQLGWTPAEVQETVWTFFRELRARTDSPLHRTQEGHRLTTATDQALAMSNADVIRGADSFAHLVRDPNVRDRLQRLGIDVEHLSEPTRLGDDATHLAVRKEARDSRVLGRIAGRVQRASDSAWANKQLAISRIHKLPDADPAVLRDIARIVGVPIAGRSGPQIARALQAYRDPAKYSRRLSDDPDWDLPLTPPQVEARVARLGAVEDSLAADKPGYEVKRLEREKDRPWTKVGPEAEKLDLVTDDDQWVRLASRKGRVLSDTEQQAINSRVQLRHDEMKTLVEKLEEATALSKDEAAARGIDVQALVKEEMAARLAYVAMERASVNAGTQAGRALAARRRIMAAGSDVTPDAMLRRIIKELPDVDKADAADLYRVYHQSPAEFTNALRLVMKPGALRKGMEYWKAGLLSGPGTHVANVAGNTIEPAAQLAETLVAAGIDKAWSARTGKPRERFVGEARYELRGQLKALPMAFSRFVDEFKAQILRQEEPDISAAGPLEYQVGAIGPGWGAIPFDVGKAVRTPFRALTISDRFFKALGYEAELYKLAYRQARKDGFVGEKADQRADQIIESARQSMGDHWRSMVEQADEGMKQRVFQGEPVKIIRSLMTLTREHPAAGFMFPFLRTPAEITRRGWQRSPMGLVGGRRGATSAEYDRQQAGLEAKGGNVVGKGEVSDAWARPLVGTALATAFSGLAAMGMLTGGGPVDKDKKKLKLATGWQPYSVRIPKGGGKYLYLPYTRFEPLSSLLGIVADAFETGDERKVGDKIMGSIAQNFSNKVFWKGLNDFATAITSPDRSAKTVITPIVASALVPAFVAKTAEAIDPTFREKRSDPGLTGLAESTARATLRRIPGVSRGEEPIYTPLGDPAQRPGNAVTRFVSPVQHSTTKAGTELEDWLVKINEAPSPIPGEVAIPKELLPRGGEYDQTGTRIVLTNEERAILAKSRRDAASILRRDLESIKRMPLDDQRDRIQKAFKGAQREAISKLWLRSPELRERARKKLKAEG